MTFTEDAARSQQPPEYITEGAARVHSIQQRDVFYNPVQVVNRDMSLVAIATYLSMRRRTADGSVTNDESTNVRATSCVKPGNKKAPFGFPVHVFEAMAASGLRTIRYAKELPLMVNEIVLEGDLKFTANDIEEVACKRIEENIRLNGLSTDDIKVTNSDCIDHMWRNRNVYDIIDLDPYGSVSPFIEAAVSTVKDGGLLCVTSTDSLVLCGNSNDTCFARYGSVGMKGSNCHEAGLRILLNFIQAAAARHRRYAVPLACFSIDFYFRLFVVIQDKPSLAAAALCTSSVVFSCPACGYWTGIPFGNPELLSDGKKVKSSKVSGEIGTCPFCKPEVKSSKKSIPKDRNSKPTDDATDVQDQHADLDAASQPFARETPLGSRMTMCGPFFTGSTYDPRFVESCLELLESVRSLETCHLFQAAKVRGLLLSLGGEVNVPFGYHYPDLMALIKLQPCTIAVFRQKITDQGFTCSPSHRNPNMIKTNAPFTVVLGVLLSYLSWYRRTVNEAAGICPFDKTAIPEIAGDDFLDTSIATRRTEPMFYPNPEPNWGPKPRAKKGKVE